MQILAAGMLTQIGSRAVFPDRRSDPAPRDFPETCDLTPTFKREQPASFAACGLSGGLVGID
jgi:hypothetical protein